MEVGEEGVDPLEVVHLEVVALVGVVAGPLDHLDQDQAQVIDINQNKIYLSRI